MQAGGFEPDRITSLDLDALGLASHRVVVLSGWEELSAEDWSRLEEFAAAGGGLILAGRRVASGSSSRKVQLERLERLFPGAGIGEFKGSSPALRVGARGPLVAGLPPAEEIGSKPQRQVLAASLPGSLAWVGARGAAGTAILYRAYGDGALVWMAFRADDLFAGPHADALLRNSLRYAGRLPIAALRAWPGGNLAAARLDLPGALLLPEPPEGRLAESFAADPERLLGQMLSEFVAVERAGGLYLPSEAARELTSAQRAAALSELTSQLGLRQVWIAGAEALATWVERRDQVEVELVGFGPGRAEVTLQNRGSRPISGATARVYLPRAARTPHSIEWTRLIGSPSVRVASNRRWIDFIAPEIEPSEQIAYSFRY